MMNLESGNKKEKTKENIKEDSNEILLLNVTYTVKDGKRDEFYNQLCDKEIIKKSRNEEGNLKYDYYFPVDNANDILLLEIWTDTTAQQIHSETPHFLELQELKKKYILNVNFEKFICKTI